MRDASLKFVQKCPRRTGVNSMNYLGKRDSPIDFEMNVEFTAMSGHRVLCAARHLERAGESPNAVVSLDHNRCWKPIWKKCALWLTVLVVPLQRNLPNVQNTAPPTPPKMFPFPLAPLNRRHPILLLYLHTLP